MACKAQLEIQKSRRYSPHGRDIGTYDEGERIELLTRIMVRERCLNVTAELQSMYTVFFETAYPTPPTSWRNTL